ncbi:hypothetical protein MHC_03590 [Mycoplasma haemocanis str. Illinois]|uniref:Uncharacterized protein n=1 Tax=Mycoplasma haemocanis (strain Illinois) TaxID=1111676 RepID=H6N7F6_MYCHN|nr:hypothetical protein [Mycoplasma haemocanis]AEW45578.1 hypothetical protein MHC_03590 [Mycoplasma haemocanis str. Illinois]
MNPVSKIAISVLAVGGATAAGGYSWHLSQLSTISSLIEVDEEVIQLTNSSSVGDWNAAWKTYKESNNAWKIPDYNSVDAPQSFKDVCLNKSQEKTKGVHSSEFQNFKKWCSRNLTVAEWLKKSNISLLNSSDTSDKWDAAWKRYKDEPKNKTQDGQKAADKDIWEIKDWTSNKDQNKASEGFKEKCSEKASLKIKNKNDDLYQQVSSWCV